VTGRGLSPQMRRQAERRQTLLQEIQAERGLIVEPYGRDLLDRMDQGLPLVHATALREAAATERLGPDGPPPPRAPVLREVAAVADSSASGSAPLDRGEPEQAATSPTPALSPRATTQRAILEALAHGPLPVADIVAAVGKTRGTIEQTLTTMMKTALIRRASRGVYALTTDSVDKRAASHAEEEGPRSPTPAAGGSTPPEDDFPDETKDAYATALIAAMRAFADTLEQELALL
jgi:hypothetical protein